MMMGCEFSSAAASFSDLEPSLSSRLMRPTPPSVCSNFRVSALQAARHHLGDNFVLGNQFFCGGGHEKSRQF
jgi:hypothetical protein